MLSRIPNQFIKKMFKINYLLCSPDPGNIKNLHEVMLVIGIPAKYPDQPRMPETDNTNSLFSEPLADLKNSSM
jgi:hypothetical protein